MYNSSKVSRWIAMQAPLDGRLFTLAGLAKQTCRRRMCAAAVRRTRIERDLPIRRKTGRPRTCRRPAIAEEFLVAADAAMMPLPLLHASHFGSCCFILGIFGVVSLECHKSVSSPYNCSQVRIPNFGAPVTRCRMATRRPIRSRTRVGCKPCHVTTPINQTCQFIRVRCSNCPSSLRDKAAAITQR